MKKLDFIKKIKNFKISIGVYIAALMGLFIVFGMMLCAFLSSYFMGNFITNINGEKSQLQYLFSTSIVSLIKDDINNKNYKSLNTMIEGFKSNRLFAYFYIEDNDTNKIIAGDKLDDIKFDSGFDNEIEHKTATLLDKYTIGFGIIVKDTSKIYRESLYKSMSMLFLLIIAFAIGASIFLSLKMSKPLKQLSKAARKITDGDFDVRIEPSKFSEINDLIDSYNEMGFQLHDLYSSLELKVQERTIALEEANHKLKETQAMMVHSEKMRSLGELVAGIAHEINNPVNFIHGNIMILQNYADDLLQLIDLYSKNAQLDENSQKEIDDLKKQIDLDFLRDDIKDLIRSCIEGTQRTKNIVLDLKNFSRMEEMVLTQFDIPKEIDTTLNILNNKYKNRITVIKNYGEDVPKIEAYGGQLNQVFMNILDNAQDAMGESGTLTINTYKVGKNVKIEFIDTGKGIPPENLKKVFDPFFTTKPVGKGTGLGMSISYRVINDHKGKIEVESQVGKGTKFTITLPISHDEKEMSLDEEIISDLRKENGVI